MSLVFTEGWELYQGTGSPPTAFTTKWGAYNKNYALNIAPGRYFGYGMQFGKDWSGTPDNCTTPAFTPKSAWIVGMNIKRGLAGHNGPFFRTYSGATMQLEFRMNNGDIQVYRAGTTLIHTFTGVLPASVNLYNPLSAVYNTFNKSVTAQESLPTGIFFKPDGTKMYVVGTNSDTVFQYTLSTPWSITTATYDSISFSVTSQETAPQSVHFSSDGTKMFIYGSTGNNVRAYSLGTAWNVSTATYSYVFSITTLFGTQAKGMTFSSDGKKMYFIGATNQAVYQCDLPTAWDLTTAIVASGLGVSPQESSPTGIEISPDGKNIIISGSTNDRAYIYNLNRPFDCSTAVYSGSFSVAGQTSQPECIRFSNDGSKMYVLGGENDTIFEYTLGGTAFGSDWYNLQFKFTTHTTTGSVRCRYNNFDVGGVGTNINTDAAASGTCDRFMFTGTTTAYRTISWVVDDFWVCNTDGTTNNDWLGAMVIEGLLPDGNGYRNDWSNLTEPTTVSANRQFFTQFGATDPSGNIIENNTLQFQAGSLSGANRYIGMIVFNDFYKNYKNYLSAGAFNLNLNIVATNTVSLRARAVLNYETAPYDTSTKKLLLANLTTAFVDFSCATGGLNTVNITSLITEWTAQSGLSDYHELTIVLDRIAQTNQAVVFDTYNNYQPNIAISSISTNNYKAVSNLNDNDFIKSNGIGNIDSYTLPEPTQVLGNIRGVVVNWSAKKGGPSTSVDVSTFVRSGTTNGHGATRTINAPFPYQKFTDIYELNPESGGVPWARSHLSDIEVGVKLEG
jgi:hypothetical protein